MKFPNFNFNISINVGQKTKFGSKNEILVKKLIFSQKKRNFGKKNEILVKKRNFGQKFSKNFPKYPKKSKHFLLKITCKCLCNGHIFAPWGALFCSRKSHKI